MQPITSYLIKGVRESLKFLLRDYFELEMLQTSSRSTEEFCVKSYVRTKEILKQELQKNFKIIFFGDEKFQLPTNSETENILLIQPIDSINNFSKSMPFFATTLTLLKNVNNAFTPTNSIIIFPALDETYYAEKGGGAWSEKGFAQFSQGKASRLRISNNFSNNYYLGIDNLNNLPDISSNLRNFGSPCYHLCLFSAGKLDAIFLKTLEPSLKLAFELFVRESGGVNIQSEPFFLASNQKNAEKIKQLILK